MLKSGELVMHETAGVCRVEGETTLQGLKGTYHILTPLYLTGATFYTPAEGSKVKLRPVMTRAAALELIGQLGRVKPVAFENANDQKLRSAAILKSGDSYQLAQLAKALYQDQQRKRGQSKRSGLSDPTALKKVESLLFGELAAALEIEYDQVLARIEAQMKENAAAD